MRVKDLEHDAARKLDLFRDVHLGHPTTAEPVEDPIAIARGATKTRDLFGRLLERGTRELGERVRAANADRRRGAIPGTTLRAEHSISRIAC
jgi:hypothetical protein